MKHKFLAPLFIIPFLISCRGRDISNLVFPISQSISQNEEGEIIFSLQILNASTISKIEVESSNADTTSYVISGKGPSLAEAVNELEIRMKRDAGPEDLRSLVVHESLINNPEISIVDSLKFLLSNPLQRPSIFLYFTREKTEDIFSVSSIRQESIVYNLLNTPQLTNIPMIVKPITYTDALVSLIDLNRTIAIPLISIDKEIATTEEDNVATPRPVLVVKEVCFNTRVKEQFTCMPQEEVVGLRWYQLAPRISIGVGDPHHEMMVNGHAISYNIEYENQHFKMAFEVDYHFISLYGEIDFNEYDQKVTQKIIEELETTFLKAKEKNIDIYHIQDFAKRSLGQDVLLEDINVEFLVKTHLTSLTLID